MKRGNRQLTLITRRGLLQASAAGFAAAGAPAILMRRASGQSGFDWKRFKGEHIEVSHTLGPRGELLQKHEKEFEELTGISVGSEQIPEQQHRQKVAIEFASGNPSFDVVTVAYHVQKQLYGKGKWLVDVRGFIKDTQLTNPDFDFDDFAKGAIDYATQKDGRLDTLPLNLDYFVIYWNKELFAAKGGSYPQSYTEIIEVAHKLNDPKNGSAGWVARGLKNANLPPYLTFLLGHGVDSIDPDLTMHMDGPEAIAAAQIYQTLNRECAPPGVTGFNWNECQTTFVLGKAAMWLDGIGFALPLEDPTKSRVVGKVGYGVMPPGPKAHRTSLYGDGIGISRFSKKQEAAWLYCQWATGKAMNKLHLEGAFGAPGRTSAYEAVKTSPNLKAPREWLECMIESIKIARAGLPDITAVTEFRDTFGVALTNMISGADPATELKKATDAFRPVLERTEKT
ncbi:MAG TPA: sugar ABC transporter substrate-binding protein [Stellaceae bacterium]|nr:sugar ABC transporter substrate-binding protein [Stellaceae bacterium]